MSEFVSTRGLLRYPGGKTRAVKTLAQHVPPHCGEVFAPFFGGGSFELFLTGEGYPVRGADIVEPLATFWQHVLTDKHSLAVEITKYLHCMDKDKYVQLQDLLRSGDGSPLQRAAWFFVVNRCSFSGATLSGGFSPTAAEKRFTPSSITRIEQFTNPRLTVEHGDAFELISEAPEDFLFVDPPYHLDDSFLYGSHGDAHKGFNHEKLAEVLLGCGKKFLLTYNDDETVRRLYDSCEIIPVSWAYGMNQSKKSSEVLVKNF